MAELYIEQLYLLQNSTSGRELQHCFENVIIVRSYMFRGPTITITITNPCACNVLKTCIIAINYDFTN